MIVNQYDVKHNFANQHFCIHKRLLSRFAQSERADVNTLFAYCAFAQPENSCRSNKRFIVKSIMDTTLAKGSWYSKTTKLHGQNEATWTKRDASENASLERHYTTTIQDTNAQLTTYMHVKVENVGTYFCVSMGRHRAVVGGNY